MKVLLCEDIKKLGWLGDVVDVNEGYARNYLLPQGLAKVATDGNIRSIAKEKAKRSEQRLQERRRIEKAVAAVNGAEAVLAARANEQGVLFGSITEAMIAANLRAQSFEVADEIVKLPEHIKALGTHEVTLRFADDLTATVRVVVVPEQVEEPAERREAAGTGAGSLIGPRTRTEGRDGSVCVLCPASAGQSRVGRRLLLRELLISPRRIVSASGSCASLPSIPPLCPRGVPCPRSDRTQIPDPDLRREPSMTGASPCAPTPAATRT